MPPAIAGLRSGHAGHREHLIGVRPDGERHAFEDGAVEVAAPLPPSGGVLRASRCVSDSVPTGSARFLAFITSAPREDTMPPAPGADRPASAMNRATGSGESG